ncbi:unnamed protein product [Albugo candida]|uniref:Arf-GAP domain-containing protein n=1 Tax=Albugo candida TaxID=65357 RepID=A0A024GPC6_9STRA|nr:unnamed protein product [Albugo candida]|eukprot:CCI48742.1 unnamed protein product [Albugo candida]
MSKFTDVEVRNLINYGGNEAARKYWRATFDVSYRAPGLTEGERLRNLLRQTYIDRKWLEVSPGEREDSPRSSSGCFSSSNKDRNALKKQSQSTQRQESTSVDFGDFSSFNIDKKDQKPVTAAQVDDFADFAKFDAPALNSNDIGGDVFDQFASFDANASKTTSMPHKADSEFMPFAVTASSRCEDVLVGSSTQSSSDFFKFELDPAACNRISTDTMVGVNDQRNLSANAFFTPVPIDNGGDFGMAEFGSFHEQNANKSEIVNAEFAPFSGAFDTKPSNAMTKENTPLDVFAEFAPSSTKSHASELAYNDSGHSASDIFASSLLSQDDTRHPSQKAAEATAHSDPFSAFDTLGAVGVELSGPGIMDNTRHNGVLTGNDKLTDRNTNLDSKEQNLFCFDTISNALPESHSVYDAPPIRQSQTQCYPQHPNRVLCDQPYPLPVQPQQFTGGMANAQSYPMVPCSPFQMFQPSAQFQASPALQPTNPGHPYLHGSVALPPHAPVFQVPQHSQVSQRRSSEKAADPFASLGIDNLGFSDTKGGIPW